MRQSKQGPDYDLEVICSVMSRCVDLEPLVQIIDGGLETSIDLSAASPDCYFLA